MWMRESPPKVITIPAKPEVASRQAVQRQLRVAAYCRVSTDDEEQFTSYEAQQKYDLLIGMDRANLRSMYRICGGDFADKMHLLMDFTDRPGEVADPWYTDDFDTTWRDVEEGCRGLLQKIISKEVRTSGQAGCQGSGN